MGPAVQLRFESSWSRNFALSKGTNSFLLDFWSVETVLEKVFVSATLWFILIIQYLNLF